MAKSTTKDRPSKPRADFPLFPHASGRWAKKVRGQLCYFGKWSDDPKGERAIQQWLDQKDDLLAGRKPRPAGVTAGVTVKELCDEFLTAKENLVASGELAKRSWADYLATCTRVADAFGRGRVVSDLRQDDFEQLRAKLSKTWGPVSVFNEIGRVRVVFKWGFDSELLDRPVRFGPGFKRPSAKTLRLNRALKGPRMFEAVDLLSIIDAAGVQLRAMIYLGINCGLGNADCARLEVGHLDMKLGWLNFPRPKTGVARRSPLWKETVKALQAALAERPEPADAADADLVFITKYGRPWRADGSRNAPLSHEFSKLLDELGLKRPGLNFYALRHTLETVGGAAKDQPALDLIMGHAPRSNDMGAVYREHIADSRLTEVCKVVRKWLLENQPQKKSRRPK